MTFLRPSLWGLVTAALLAAAPASAFDIPQNDGFVTDTVGVVTQEQDQELEQTLAAYKQETSNEIAVIIVQTLSGASIADTAVEIGRKWGVGGAEKNNGILILVSYEEREVFIATGYGLEGAVPDIVAKGVVEEDMVPHFRDGEYGEGIAAAVDALKKHIGGEYTADRYSDAGEGWFPFVLFFIFIGLQVLGPVLGQSRSWWAGGAIGGLAGVVLTVLYTWWLSIPLLVIFGLIFDFIVSKIRPSRGRWRGGRGGFGGGGFGGGSSGGGFGGFSGGSFGGGGAGGRW